MTKMSDLPSDLAVEILARTPVTSLKKVRSTCQTWNTISKDDSFSKKHLAQAKAAAARDSVVVMLIDYEVYLMSFNLHGIHKGLEPSIHRKGKLISPVNYVRVGMALVHHCNGLLLCVTENYKRFLVCNPFLGQNQWIKPRVPSRFLYPINWYKFALGYDKNNNYKVLMFCNSDYPIYELNSKSWRVLDVTPTRLNFARRPISLKGNAYWLAGEESYFLVCFDFTTERFGTRLGLPFQASVVGTIILSSVGEDQLVVLFSNYDTLQMEIWVTSKIEPEVVSWNKIFLSVDMIPLKGVEFSTASASFFIDVEKKAAVVFDKLEDTQQAPDLAYIFGENGYFRTVDLNKCSYKLAYSLVCSYVPSLVQIK